MMSLFGEKKQQPSKKYQPVVSVGDLPTYHIIIDENTGIKKTIDTRTGLEVDPAALKKSKQQGVYAPAGKIQDTAEKRTKIAESNIQYDSPNLKTDYNLESLEGYRDLIESRLSKYQGSEQRVKEIDLKIPVLLEKYYTSREREGKSILNMIQELKTERETLLNQIELFKPSGTEIEKVLQQVVTEAEGIKEQFENDMRLIKHKRAELESFYNAERIRLEAITGRAVKTFNESVAFEIETASKQTQIELPDFKVNLMKYI